MSSLKQPVTMIYKSKVSWTIRT